MSSQGNPPLTAPVAEPRAGRELHDATRPFAQENVVRSWLHVGTTFLLITALLVIAAIAVHWPVRVAASLLGALVMVRGFILYHDHMHGALLPRSRMARALFRAYAAVALTPPRSWRDSHNYHHQHVGTIAGSNVGSFPLMTTEMWNASSRSERIAYRIARHPLTVLLSYLTIFFGNIVMMALVKNPRRYWDSAISLLVHGTLVATIWMTLGFWAVFFSILLPVAIAAAMGGYLFFAQHNFRGMQLMPPDQWTHFDAALVSSSFMKLGPVMNWFTGNIGYHHIHHLNPRIPFYRLPEVMAALPEVQHPHTTSLRPGDIADCFRLALWDTHQGKLITFREARAQAA